MQFAQVLQEGEQNFKLLALLKVKIEASKVPDSFTPNSLILLWFRITRIHQIMW